MSRQAKPNIDSLVRTEKELELMRKSGWITGQALKKVIESAKIGQSLLELERIAKEEIKKLGGQPAFKTVPGYFWATCLTVNEEVVHGIPTERKLLEGDLLSIDLGAIYQGWYTDAAWTVIVSEKKDLEKVYPDKVKFLKTGEQALAKALAQAVAGNRIGDISSAIQKEVESAGYSIVRSLTGHGVGRSYHEEPEIPGFGKKGTGRLLKKGMSLAVEVIYTAGSGEVYEKTDGWTIASTDNSWGGLFEHTVIVGKDKPEIITKWQ